MILFVTTHGLGWRTPDGITWTPTPSQPGPGWTVNSLTWAPQLGLWLAATTLRFNPQQVSTSPDLSTWTPPVTLNATGSADSNFPGAIAWSGTRFVFIGSQIIGATAVPIAMWSADAATWHTASVPPAFGHIGTDVCWSPTHSLFIATGTGSNPVATSPDGDTWTALPVSGSASGTTVNVTSAYSVAEHNGTVIVGGSIDGPLPANSAAFISTDLATWQWTNPGGTPTGGIFGLLPTTIAFLGGRWWAGTFADIGTGRPQVAPSPAGTNNDPSGVCWNPRYSSFFLVDTGSYVTGIALKPGAVPTRQYPRDDNLAIGSTRQGGGRSSSVQHSVRQGWQGTYT